MVRPLREWYLPSTGLYPLETHHLLAQTYLAYQSPILSIDIHSCQAYTPQPQNQHPKHLPIHPTKVFPYQNSKEFKSFKQGRVELSSFKKTKKRRKERKERIPLSIPKGIAK